MDKKFLEDCLKKGMSTRDIELICDKNHRTISYWIQKYELSNLSKYKKNEGFVFDKIDSPEKAYILGFILADGAINHSIVEITTTIQDKYVVEFIAKYLNSNVRIDMTFNKKKKRFPRARTSKKINDISKYVGGAKKEDRHYPRIRDDLERYLILGFFDADGCITYGRRKDKNRLWQKISFTSQLKILEGVQQYLLKKVGISTIIRQKSDEKCYVLEFSNRLDVLKFCEHIYADEQFIVLRRKYLKYKALRLELEENGEIAV